MGEVQSPGSLDRSTAGKSWFVYILKCRDGSFYTGTTNNLVRRFKQHHEGRASRYTRTRLPVKMVYQEACTSRSQALIREWEVKSLTRRAKEVLVASGKGRFFPLS